MSYTPADQEACANQIGAQEIYWEVWQKEMAIRFPDELAKIAKDASQWIVDEENDPTESLADIYLQAALYWDEPEQIGEYVKAFLDGKITSVLEWRIENGE